MVTTGYIRTKRPNPRAAPSGHGGVLFGYTPSTHGITITYVYVIARVGVKFGINFTSVRLSGNTIARGEAECYLPLNLTRVKFVPEISRLTVLLKINTIASLLFI